MSIAGAILAVGAFSLGAAASVAIDVGHVWPLGVQIAGFALGLAFFSDRERRAHNTGTERDK